MILAARWVVPVAAPPIRDGFVALDGRRIARVGPRSMLPADAGDVEDLGHVILTPGLVNPHTHLELTDYAPQVTAGPLWSWLPQLVVLRRRPDAAEREHAAAAHGAELSLRAGVTCVGDISRRPVHWRSLKPAPIRKVCFIELISNADLPPRTPQDVRVALDEVEEDELLTAGVTPHAPYTVRYDHFRAVLELAQQRQRPWCTHWVETPEEDAFLRGNPQAFARPVQDMLRQCGVVAPGTSPAAYLEQLTRGVAPGLLAHCNYVGTEPDEVERLAAGQHVVVFCPRAHHYFGHDRHPWRTLREAGVPVALGTDSLASNQSLAPLDELRFLRAGTGRDIPAADLLRLVTLDAARALGLDGRIATLEAGKLADLAAFDGPRDATDPLEYLATQAPRARGVWVNGRRVF